MKGLHRNEEFQYEKRIEGKQAAKKTKQPR